MAAVVSSVTVNVGDRVNLAPQPISSGGTLELDGAEPLHLPARVTLDGVRADFAQ
jgi:hypothetical protein